MKSNHQNFPDSLLQQYNFVTNTTEAPAENTATKEVKRNREQCSVIVVAGATIAVAILEQQGRKLSAGYENSNKRQLMMRGHYFIASKLDIVKRDNQPRSVPRTFKRIGRLGGMRTYSRPPFKGGLSSNSMPYWNQISFELPLKFSLDDSVKGGVLRIPCGEDVFTELISSVSAQVHDSVTKKLYQNLQKCLKNSFVGPSECSQFATSVVTLHEVLMLKSGHPWPDQIVSPTTVLTMTKRLHSTNFSNCPSSWGPNHSPSSFQTWAHRNKSETPVVFSGCSSCPGLSIVLNASRID
ncbi:hypothetical protein CUMW_263130 [Citrus unshiu]|uniref:Uncharacterized protein n=1 Tax=Citrus unshiu TaxID=55188 RepID=A0A2H5QUK7_CITUN|nr:hypothetical protein CUMW_263130 [Citrus unshiu]